MRWKPKVHFDDGGQSRCRMGRQLTADRDKVTCGTCDGILSGTWGTQVSRPSGYQWADVKPHGTAAAARRHYRHGTPPCDSCRQHEKRRGEDYRRDPRRAA
jgi:hypothetical protein